MTLSSLQAEDLALVRDWFAELARHVEAVDYAGARHLFDPDMVAFGTFTENRKSSGVAAAQRSYTARRCWR